MRRITNQRLEWASTTGEDSDGVILRLDAPEDAEVTFYFRLDEIGYEPLVVNAGGVNQRVKVSAISGRELPKNLEFSYI